LLLSDVPTFQESSLLIAFTRTAQPFTEIAKGDGQGKLLGKTWKEIRRQLLVESARKHSAD
jgi:hypothetical protein